MTFGAQSPVSGLSVRFVNRDDATTGWSGPEASDVDHGSLPTAAIAMHADGLVMVAWENTDDRIAYASHTSADGWSPIQELPAEIPYDLDLVAWGDDRFTLAWVPYPGHAMSADWPSP